jgi:chemotaxis protein MotB
MVMGNKYLYIILFLIGSLGLSCVPKARYLELKDTLQDTQQQLKHEKIRSENLVRSNAKLLEELSNLQDRYVYSTKISQQLYDSIESLSVELKKKTVQLEKKSSVIALQDQVIKLLDDTKKSIESSLKTQIAAQGVEIVDMADKLKVVMIDQILYDSGSYEINEDGKKLLLILADSFRENRNHHLVVAGHTDNVPLKKELRKKFASNWELSAARAAAVARFLLGEGGLEPEKISISAYSYYQPIASNSTEEGRRQNRRIEIILQPEK